MISTPCFVHAVSCATLLHTPVDARAADWVLIWHAWCAGGAAATSTSCHAQCPKFWLYIVFFPHHKCFKLRSTVAAPFSYPSCGLHLLAGCCCRLCGAAAPRQCPCHTAGCPASRARTRQTQQQQQVMSMAASLQQQSTWAGDACRRTVWHA